MLSVLMIILMFQEEEDAKLITTTPSNLNRFSNFFSPLVRDRNFKNMSYKNFTTPYVCCHTSLGKLEVEIYLNLWR